MRTTVIPCVDALAAGIPVIISDQTPSAEPGRSDAAGTSRYHHAMPSPPQSLHYGMPRSRDTQELRAGARQLADGVICRSSNAGLRQLRAMFQRVRAAETAR